MLKGSCCCGTVRFEVATQPELMGTCHCTRCRKVGASTFVLVSRENFSLLAGEEYVAIYEPEENYRYRRSFCCRCGSALGEIIGEEESFPIPANCFDDPLDFAVGFHEFVVEKPAWSLICDEAKVFERHPHPD